MPPKLLQLCLLSIALCSLAHAGPYKSVVTAPDMATLTIQSTHGDMVAPHTLQDQRGFGEPRIAPDGAAVGWLALVDTCCTSYPLPMALVLFKQGKVFRTITEAQPIFAWQFARKGTAVAYMQTYPHGLVPYAYKLRRISDGKLLQQFTCTPVNDMPDTEPTYQNSGPVPAWVWSLAADADCPVRAAVEK